MKARPRAGQGRRLALALACSALSAFPCMAQSQPLTQADAGLLRAEFWADTEPVAAVGEEWPVSPGLARSRILEEAAWVFGGMIWGFEFSYTPYDKTRAIEERFDIAAIESLPADAPSLARGARASTGQEYRSYVEYRPDAGMVRLMEDYARGPWRSAQGTGRAGMGLGVKGRREACKDALRAAVRSLLQGLEPNKPRLARGRVVLDRPPGLAIVGGFYTAQVRARVMVVEVVPYTVY